MAEQYKIGIIGAGLAGLSCAYHLEKLGFNPVLFDKNEGPGGRCATDLNDGFLLDRGFQVLLTSYAEVKKIIRFYELDLKRFPSGVNVYDGKSWHSFYNPLKHPFSIFGVRNLPFAYFGDFVKMGSIYMKSAFKTGDPYFLSIGKTTEQFLVEQQLSKPFIDKFLRPFFGSIFLDSSLSTNPGIFEWILHFFVEGAACLPRQGMGIIPNLILKKLKKTKVNFNKLVSAVEGRTVYFKGGEEAKFDKIVLATDAPQARALVSTLPELVSKSVTCLYFTIDTNAFKKEVEPILHLNGSGEGPINHLAFLNLVQPSYAPKKKILASVSVISPEWQNNAELVSLCSDQLAKWFDTKVQAWKFLKKYFIPHALPDQKEPPLLQGKYVINRSPDILLCGEYVDYASFNGACLSGRKVADEISKILQNEKQK